MANSSTDRQSPKLSVKLYQTRTIVRLLAVNNVQLQKKLQSRPVTMLTLGTTLDCRRNQLSSQQQKPLSQKPQRQVVARRDMKHIRKFGQNSKLAPPLQQ